MFSLFLLTFDKKLNHTRLAKDVSVETGHRFYERIVTDGAHFECFNGVLTNTSCMSTVLSFEFLAFLIGEDC